MKFYFAGQLDADVYKMLSTAGGHFLFSFADVKRENLHLFPKNKVFLDSGAFSMATRGIPLSVDNYAKFLYEEKLPLYANLDVIGDATKTKDNQLALESLGLSPLPVFHFNATKDEMLWYCDRYEYIAVGGLVPHAADWERLTGFLDHVYKTTTINNKPHKFHGFGMGAWRTMGRYPFYSVDSTGWFKHAVFHDPRHAPSGIRKIIRHTCTRAGYMRYEMNEYLRREKKATDIWKLRGIIWE